MGVWEEVLGSLEGPLGVRETGGVGITGWGVRVTGRGSWQCREVGEGPPSLADVCSSGTGGDVVVDTTRVSAETNVRPATAFLGGKGAMAGAGAIHFMGAGPDEGGGGGGHM